MVTEARLANIRLEMECFDQLPRQARDLINENGCWQRIELSPVFLLDFYRQARQDTNKLIGWINDLYSYRNRSRTLTAVVQPLEQQVVLSGEIPVLSWDRKR